MTHEMEQDRDLTPSQRLAALESVDRNLALRSGAGCGKTLVLARRYAQLLLTHEDMDDPLSHFVALTFTDKATLEMIARVRKTLMQYAAQCPAAQRRRVLDWLGQLPEARISTIHGFCSSLLRTHAIEAGLDPGFAVCPDTLAVSKMHADAVERAVLAAVQHQDKDVLPLLLVVKFDRLIEQVQRLSAMSTACDLPALADADATFARWQARLAAMRKEAWPRFGADDKVKAALEQLESFHCADDGDKLCAPREQLVDGVRGLLKRRQYPAMDDFAFLSVSCRGGTAGAWGSKETAQAVRDAIKSLCAAVEPYVPLAEDLGEGDRQAAEMLAVLARLALQANELFAARKREQGVLDFDDLLEQTGRLIENHPAVAAAARKQIEQLLVDEAQDTDAFQIRLLERLIFGLQAGDALPEGKLFIVGDAKQSIYRFRGAEVSVFEALCSRLGKDNQESLRDSFRTHAAGTTFVNHLFAPLMGEGYEPTAAHRKELPPQESVEIILATSSREIEITDAASASRAQAAVTAERIARMVEARQRLVWDRGAKAWRPAEYRDVAILFSRMTSSLDYESMLARRGVPYYVVGGTGFFRQQEVFDLLNALAAIDNPFDDLSVIGVLRGSLFGLDDDALMHLAARCQPPYLPAIAAADLAGMDGRMAAAARRACQLVQSLHARKDALGIDELIEHVLDATGYRAMLLSQFNGKRMAGNVQRLTELARAASRDKMSLAGFLSQMNEQVIDESRYEQAAVASEAQNVVRLMTVHKAKGLEFPIVVLPDLNAGRRGVSADILCRWDWGVAAKVPAPQDDEAAQTAQPLSYRLAKTAENEDLAAEDIRRLYVAMTRHQDHLVLIGADLRTKTGEIADTSGYLAMLDRQLNFSAAIADGTLPYGRFKAAVYHVAAKAPRPTRRDKSAGEELLDTATTPAELAAGLLKLPAAADGTLPLLGPLPATAARVELAATALGDFEYCPMYYRWQQELRVPVPWAGPLTPPPPGAPREPLDPASMGTLLHRCMELLDFAAPQPAAALAAQAAAEMELGAEAIPAVSAMLEDMIARLAKQPLGGQLATARRRLAELEFVSRTPQATLRGKIDLLFQDQGGTWHIVDYKSDRVGEEGLEVHARRYELQMQIYAEAAWRYLRAAGEGEGVADITLYFLRTGACHVQALTPAGIEQARARLADLATRLTIARRSGQFDRCHREHCGYCMYREYCQKSHGEA